jgi:hypothetical protein
MMLVHNWHCMMACRLYITCVLLVIMLQCWAVMAGGYDRGSDATHFLVRQDDCRQTFQALPARCATRTVAKLLLEQVEEDSELRAWVLRDLVTLR